MNHYLTSISPGTVKAAHLPEWALAHGITSLTSDDIAYLCGIPKNHVSQRMAVLKKDSKIFTPARGLWVPISPEYRTWGAPDPMRYIAEMMSYLGIPYVVGWLSAAACYGANHQAPQVFQTAAARTVANQEIGRSRLEFYVRSYVEQVSISPELERKFGARIASVGTTMLMVAADPGISGGISNAATVIVELAEENPAYSDTLLGDARLFPAAASRRLGWILAEFGEGAPDSLMRYCANLKTSPSFLSPSRPKEGSVDPRWKLIINEEVEPDL